MFYVYRERAIWNENIDSARKHQEPLLYSSISPPICHSISPSVGNVSSINLQAESTDMSNPAWSSGPRVINILTAETAPQSFSISENTDEKKIGFMYTHTHTHCVSGALQQGRNGVDLCLQSLLHLSDHLTEGQRVAAINRSPVLTHAALETHTAHCNVFLI